MTMGIIYEEDIPWAIENDIEFFVYNIERLPKTLAAAKKVGKAAKVHIEVETGANNWFASKGLSKGAHFSEKE